MQLLFNTVMLEVNRWTEHHKITYPLIDLLELLKKADFTALEVWQYHISSLSIVEVKELKRKLDLLNMTVPGVGGYVTLHFPEKGNEKHNILLNHMIKSASILGATTFKILSGNIPSASVDEKTWNLSVSRIKDLAGKLANNGMQLSIETHAYTLCDNKESVFRLFNDLNDVKNVGICYQPFDAQTTEEAMETFTEMLPHIIHIHLQNLPEGNAETTTFLETGKWMDYTKLLPHIASSGYNKIFSLEFTEGIFPPKGKKFNPQIVIDNAVIDREFFNKWLKLTTKTN